ncbi:MULTISPECIES: Cd(II)/Pb(II)-responsive transcriptional regulator [unclassified Marinimicrobium]|jgi:Cd(II)/Pb(II)-responsive transcriptional regulator|uniref:Cd(II)/Pb(II)-responsive transcriptional regulator n=1 Tax=Marinimicrobium TaxID=359337 RepID=UPI000C681B55|nr:MULTISPECIES: Cd(II)/Pb(II)-responsive transcriptional regulator [unclassified Marinimicrobium]MAN50307.1 Cd(II)/Pb(II)-responsive transcriptional regulator [Marinimicrobium sp.]MAN50341.1 Cd(II)/Pb(II)-responsive transcriptional regulator [Marinimicrobium sp.]|tara:strand:+ start:165 stop:581 length:417 start_codon:yes stop_codon:yes gene_type:complete
MRIGALAKKLGLPVETIRFWEKKGLLPEPSRTESNYRDYGDRDLMNLQFIRNCRGLDMSLDDIRQLIQLRSQRTEYCSSVNDLIDNRIAQVTIKIKTLQALEVQLRSLRQACAEGRSVEQCGILQGLTERSRSSMTKK